MKTPLITAAYAILVFVAPPVASQSQSTELRIRVVKQAWGKTQPSPFTGVGVFDLLRGNSKFERASCPDRSGATGELLCRISCELSDDDSVMLRVRPPSNQDYLAGWVTPPPQDVQVQRCEVTPALITMQYQDARYALNDLLTKQKLVAVGGESGGTNVAEGGQWLGVFSGDPGALSKIAGEAAAEPSGRATLTKVYRLASEGTKLPVPQADKGTEADRKQAAALAGWQLLSKSALLQAQLNREVPADDRKKLQLAPTSDLTKFRENLTAADQFLSSLANKSPEQLKLADDIKTLKSLPATGQDAASAAAIIDEWK